MDLSKNQIKNFRKKIMNNLKILNLSDNKLKDIDGLLTPNMIELYLNNNKSFIKLKRYYLIKFFYRIGTCAGIMPISQMSKLRKLSCIGNPVTERRVYKEYIRNHVSDLKELDKNQIITSFFITSEKFTNQFYKSTNNLNLMQDTHLNTINGKNNALIKSLFPQE